MTPSHAPIPAIEFERAELLAAEKESIGLFISAHPLKEVRAALRARVDCPLADLADKRDGDWVLVGGMITEAKKIRTKKGDPMMFATLDDLEGSVELLVFGNALPADAEVLAADSIVLVRGRVDHKDRDKTCIVAQQIEPFRPTAEEVTEAEEQEAKRPVAPSALRLRLDATALAASVLGELKDVLAGFPGECEVVIELTTSIGDRRLKLGTGLPRDPQREPARGARRACSDTRSSPTATSPRTTSAPRASAGAPAQPPCPDCKLSNVACLGRGACGKLPAMLGLPNGITACLFDLDGVLTQTAKVHAKAWKQMFDAYLRERADRDGEPFHEFALPDDYDTYVDGKPRSDGVRSFLQSRNIDLPEGSPTDTPDDETIYGLGLRKNELVTAS